ncbi:hypothetical protein [Nocardioides dongkuii]|uniref:hypothetical protein n=1 Tax=Nocardioides dongkuii TaxID=2760089 RepID=UPI0015FC957C|nr:hypothetical protein [Nocardioides dongkuii]
MRHPLLAAGLLVPVLVPVLVACGSSTDVGDGTEGEVGEVGAPPAATAYDGPLHVSRAEARHPRAGAAGDVVRCDTWGDGGFEDAEVYAEGATSGSPAGALETAASEHVPGTFQFQDGLTVAARTDDRVLYVLEVDGVAKQALVVHDGEGTEGAGGDGWYLESWAQCDPAELPREHTDAIGLEVWTDGEGRPVPTTELSAWRGPEHCDWQSMTFLRFGERRPGPTYVRDPQRWLRDQLVVPWEPSTTLPDGATDTGLVREGRRLWRTPDAVYVGRSPADVEQWPRLRESPGCA